MLYNHIPQHTNIIYYNNIQPTTYIRLAYPHLYSINEQGYILLYILHPDPNHIRIGV